MRLQELKLVRFGPFTDGELLFSEPGKRIHVIYGDNEAGKSTVLRSISALLFGIDERTQDAHLHATNDLRIGGTLENDAGDTLRVVRRKGRKDTLLDLDGGALPESLLHAYTGGITKDVFEAMFGLDHERLVAGGRDLLEGHGEVGQALFGAAAGLRGLHDLVARFQSEAGDLFKNAGSKPRLNQALRHHQEARKSVRKLALKPSAWATAKRGLEEGRAELVQIQQTYREARAHLEQRQLLKAVLPDVREHEAIQARRAELGEVPLLPEDARDHRRNAERILKENLTRREKLSDEEQRLHAEHVALDVPDPLLALEARIAELAGARAIHLKAATDRSGLASKLNAGVIALDELLRRLPLPKSPEEIEALRIDTASQARIRDLIREGDQLEAKAAASRDSAREATARAKKAEEDLRDLPPTLDGTALASAVKTARRAGDLEANHRGVSAELSAKRQTAELRTATLTLWGGTPEAAASLPLPLDATIERFEQDFGDAAETARLLASRRHKLDDELAELREEIVALESGGSIPTARDLNEKRERRDGLWATIRGVWLDGAAQAQSSPTLAGDYQDAVRSADTLGDQMFAEHKRVAQIEEHRARENRIQRNLQGLEQETSALNQRKDQLADAWRQAWEPTGVAPSFPREMRAWKAQQQNVATLVGESAALEDQLDTLGATIETHRQACSQSLVTLGENELDPSLGLAALLDVAEARLAVIEANRERRDHLSEVLTTAAETRTQRNGELAQTEESIEDWRTRWEQSIAPLHLPATARPSEAEAMLELLDQSFTKHAELNAHRERIRHIDADNQAFAEEIEALAGEACPDLLPGTPDIRAADLLARLEGGRSGRTRREEILARLDAITAEQGDAERERAAAETTLASYVEIAGVESPDLLEAAESRSQEVRSLESRRVHVEERLRRSGRRLEDLVEATREIEEDPLNREIEELNKALTVTEDLRDQKNQQFANLQSDFEAMDGGATAAAANETAEEALAEIAHLTSEYALKQVAAVMLNREIQRFAQSNQGPILSRASQLFQRLTLGRYTSISSTFSARDEMILVCNRVDKVAAEVQQLSDGTRDQLYLSLRLAALEHHMQANESMPLIVDDVLLTFDDPRSRATFETLGAMANTRQVLFFTHHRRLVELAEEAIPKEFLEVHELRA